MTPQKEAENEAAEESKDDVSVSKRDDVVNPEAKKETDEASKATEEPASKDSSDQEEQRDLPSGPKTEQARGDGTLQESANEVAGSESEKEAVKDSPDGKLEPTGDSEVMTDDPDVTPEEASADRT